MRYRMRCGGSAGGRFVSFRKAEDGATMVEFALVAGVFGLLLLGLVEFGLLAWQKSMVTGAARDGTRWAIVRGSASGREADSAAVSAYVRGRTGLAPVRVTATWPVSNDPGDQVHVRVEYTSMLVSAMLGFVIPDSVVLASTSRMVIVF